MTAPRKGRSVEKENMAVEAVSSALGWGTPQDREGVSMETWGLRALLCWLPQPWGWSPISPLLSGFGGVPVSSSR